MPAHRSLASSAHMRSSITMLVLVAIVALAAWFGWRSLTHDSSSAELVVTACPLPSQTPGAPVVRPADVRVNVYNSTAQAGLGAETAADLTARGFRVLATDNDPLKKQIAGPAEVRSNQKQQAAAALVAAQVPGTAIVFDERPDDTVDLVVGEAFQGLAVRQTATPQPPTPGPTGGAPAPAPTPTVPTC